VADALIEVKDLRFAYRNGEEVLRGLSFSVGRGELVALTGPSGSGKSTLFYLLGCLLDKYTGEISIQGRATKDLSAFEKSYLRNEEIGFVFQQFFLLPRATVLENILLPAYFPNDSSKPTAQDRAKAIEIARKLGFEELLDRKPQELSGGQQQRVAIARALLKNPDLILADEPTGNLDTKSSDSVMKVLLELHAQGHTVVIITHSPEIADQCQRVLRIRDGQLESDVAGKFQIAKSPRSPPREMQTHSRGFGLSALVHAIPNAWQNILRSKARSALTMLGVCLGVGAVLTTMSLGSFAKKKILAGYEVLGVNTLQFSGYGNWRSSGTFHATATFQNFEWERDILPLFRVFKEIEMASPLLYNWRPTLSFGGRSLAENTMAVGVGNDFFAITGVFAARGRLLSVFDLDSASAVCVIGNTVLNEVFMPADPIGKTLSVGQDGGSSMPCRVVGVLEKQPPSADSSTDPNRVVLMPFTYFQKAAMMPWEREMRDFLLKIKSGVDPTDIGAGLEGYFRSRYGDTGVFQAGTAAKLISQMKLFLNIFSGLLAAVAVIALIVGGVGINNMMLANLSERLKELGLRKALGATPRHLRYLMLTESLLLCFSAGLIGLVGGFLAYEGLILGATKLIPDLEFEWIFQPVAFALSFVAIIATGVLSGFIPAMKAERLDVMEAMRQET
jgi:macrolide transport system ATP-binding/permease protein